MLTIQVPVTYPTTAIQENKEFIRENENFPFIVVKTINFLT